MSMAPDPDGDAATTPYLPLFLRATGENAGGRRRRLVAARRVETLARAGALVTVYAPRLDEEEFAPLRERFAFAHVAREPTRADLAGALVCYIATGDRAADERLYAALNGAGPPINVADRPDLSDFISPSILDRSPLVVAVSTGGASPLLGRMLRARLETLIPAAYGRLAAFVGRSRALVAPSCARRSRDAASGSACSKGRSPNWCSPTTSRRPRRRSPKRSNARRRAASAAARRGLSRRRRPGRCRSADLPRAPADAEGRRRALRPAGRSEHRRSGAARGRAHLCRQAPQRSRAAAGRDQRHAGQARARGQARAAAEGRRPVHFRPRRRRDRNARRTRHPVPGLPRRHRRDRLRRLCRHPADPSRPRAGLRLRHRPWPRRPARSRLGRRCCAQPDRRDLHGSRPYRRADAGFVAHGADPALPAASSTTARARTSASSSGRSPTSPPRRARRRCAARRSSSSARSSRCATSSIGTRRSAQLSGRAICRPPRARNRCRAASRAPPQPRRRPSDNRSSAFRGASRPTSSA